MFSVGRIVTTAVLGVGIYAGFFALPPGERGEGRFDPDRLAAQEVDVWKASRAHEEFGLYMALVPMQREQHRYSWFRAAQSAYYLAHAMTAFVDMKTRYERVLPDLEDAAAIERDWMGASFDPAAVARAELDWWVTRRLVNLNSVDQVAPLIATDYSLRYNVSGGQVLDAAMRRAQAAELADRGVLDPNWTAITKLLSESHRALQQALLKRRPVR